MRSREERADVRVIYNVEIYLTIDGVRGCYARSYVWGRPQRARVDVLALVLEAWRSTAARPRPLPSVLAPIGAWVMDGEGLFWPAHRR
ncbi:hypothetical protein ABZ820_22040 [Streptomyces diacarni]|uniref:hypothetical protein n=1 Tax=Streptomyces diacarni TaxID=2800381 RepID=UPI0033FC964F